MENSELIKKIKRYVNTLLLPLDEYYYHHYEHALDVMERVIYLWKKEFLENEDIEMLAIAALFHDTWFIIEYENNEIFWAKIAKNFLKSILYPQNKITKIEKIIYSTSLNVKPKSILEKIIKDADLDNLWRNDFFEKWKVLKQEIETIKRIKIKDPEWIHASIDLLYNHRYFTETQKKERNPKKMENLKNLKKITKPKSKNV